MPPLKDRWADPREQQLVLRVRDGDPLAFEALFHSHFAAVFRFALSFVEAPDVAEDLAQDVFAWIWVHRREWMPSSDVVSYLLAAVRNRALDVLRKEKRRGEAQDRHGDTEEPIALASAIVPIDVQLEDAERNAAVWRAVLELPEQRRTVLLLRWRHGLEWGEIASMMGTTVAGARMNHSRALQALRQRLPGGLV